MYRNSYYNIITAANAHANTTATKPAITNETTTAQRQEVKQERGEGVVGHHLINDIGHVLLQVVVEKRERRRRCQRG